MKLWKSSVLIIGIAVLLFSSMTVTAETETDATGDVLHWQGTDWHNWQWNVGDKPNIDIKELSYELTADTLTISMTVNDNFSSVNTIYHMWYNSSDAYYHIGSTLGASTAWSYPLNPDDWTYQDLMNFTMSQTNVSIDGDTISATFDLIGDEHTKVQFWGWAEEWLSAGTEFWIDYAPNEFSPYGEYEEYLESGDDDGEDADEGDGDGANGNGSGDNGGTSTGTPGFEIIAVITSLAIALIILRRRK